MTDETVTPAPATDTVADRHAAMLEATLADLDTLKTAVVVMAENTAEGSIDWGHVGDLARVGAAVSNLLGSLGVDESRYLGTVDRIAADAIASRETSTRRPGWGDLRQPRGPVLR